MTISATETAKISVEMALISGVMPRRRRPQISRGRVLSRPIRKKVTAISSMESVKISRPAAISESLRLGSVIAPEGLPRGGAEIERGFFLCAIHFLQAGEEFGGGDGNEGGAVAEKYGEQTERQADEDGEH